VFALIRSEAMAYLAASEGLAASTFNRRYASLASFARWCIKQGRLDADPLLGIERRKQPRGGVRALDPEAVEAVLRSIRDPRDRALFWLIYEGGLRASEALAIDICDVDWAERAIRVQGKGNRPREAFFSRRVSHYLEGVRAGLGSAPTAAHRNQRQGGAGLHQGGAQTLQRATEPGSVHRTQLGGGQAQGARVGAPARRGILVGLSRRDAR